jgi:hypothetical protein
MGFSAAKKALITALEAGSFQHEARGTISEKNLLAIGEVTETEVIRMLRRTRGAQYSRSGHHWDPGTTVHLFRPGIGGARWYIKAYFIDPNDQSAMFISVHK